MSQIKLYLLGPPRLERAGKYIEINLRKALALFIYLAVTRQAHSRDALATLFWPEKDQQAARANLRRALFDLGQLLGEQLLDVGPEIVAIPIDRAPWIDSAEFQRMLAMSLPSDWPVEVMQESTILSLAAAAELYTDDFLAGFTLPDAPAFDDWQLNQREELRRTWAKLLQHLVSGYQGLGKNEEALRYTRRRLQLDPLEEEVQRQLMQLYAQAGKVAAALRQYEECARILEAELGVAPEEETTALYEAIRTRRFPVQGHQKPLATAIPARQRNQATLALGRVPADSQDVANALPHNLPVQPTPFVGREQELADILRRLEEPACRLLTLVGPGGIGKTRLALQAAQRIVDEEFSIRKKITSSPTRLAQSSLPSFADGVFFVALQPVDAVSGIIAAIAEATGFRFYSDIPPQQQLVNFLREKEMLLVLDTLEHLPGGAHLISELLTKTFKLKLLVTSQRSLNLHEEWFHPLAGMTLPRLNEIRDALASAGNEGPNPNHADAVRFFVKCALRVRADFALDVEQEEVMRICRLVDGIPLAIELAAAWSKVLPCKEIADEIERSLDILTARHQNIPVRHRSMHAVLERSWQQLLDDGERALLMRLSIFHGGFTQEAALQVVNASFLTLVTLVEKAVVWVTSAGRYQMHELLRQFAQRRLAAEPQTDSVARTAHSAYYLRFLSVRSGQLIGNTRRITLTEINQEIENVRLGWEWAMKQRNLALLSRAVEPLYHFYQIQSRYLEGKEIFTHALDSLQQGSKKNDNPQADSIAVRLLARCGAFCYFLCEYNLAGQYLQECLVLAQRTEQREEKAFALNFLGQLAVWQGDQARASSYLLESLAISRELVDKSGVASTLEKLANFTYATFGEYAESKELATESLALSRELGRPDWIAYALDTLGFITFCLGEYNEAEIYYRESLALFESIDDHYGIAMAFGGIGLVLWAMGGEKNIEAAACLQKSLAICRTIGHQGQVVGRLAGLARIANDLGEYDEAQQIALEGLTSARELGSPVYLSHLLYCLGESAYAMGNLKTAQTYLLEALHVTSKTGLLANLSIVLFHYAILLIKESEDEPADSTQKQAQAYEVLTLIQRHPTTWQVYKERAQRRFLELELQLPNAIVTAAKASASRHTLVELVTTLSNAEI